MTDVLILEPHINLATIQVWEPRWHDNICLVAKRKISQHNKIIFTKAKSLKGKEFYLSEKTAQKWPLESNGSILCYAIPMGELKLMKQMRSW